MSEAILVNHGESKMNEKNLFCGWSDLRMYVIILIAIGNL